MGVESVEKQNKSILSLRDTAPKRVQWFAQVITYPFCVVKSKFKKKKLLLNKNATISSGIFLSYDSN
jgi:hypothetical protein